MSARVDCGAKRGGPLCTACTKIAAGIGHSPEERLSMLGWSPSGFQMQSHHDGLWTPMEDGAGKSVWQPRKTAYEAVHKCISWTGGVAIPAMRVIDMATGDVIWQDRWADGKDGGLDRVIPAWAEAVYGQVKAEQQREQAVRAADRKPAADDGALFSLAEMAS